MGLLPTTTSDWLAFLSPKEVSLFPLFLFLFFEISFFFFFEKVLENSFGGSFVPQ